MAPFYIFDKNTNNIAVEQQYIYTDWVLAYLLEIGD